MAETLKEDKQSAFAMIPAVVINDPEVSATDIRVYGAMASFLSVDRYCYPSINTIANRTGVSYRTVTRSLARLEKLGYVKRANQYIANGGRGSNIYFLDLNPTTAPRASVTHGVGQERPIPSDTSVPLSIQSKPDINFKKLKHARTHARMEKSADSKPSIRNEPYTEADFNSISKKDGQAVQGSSAGKVCVESSEHKARDRELLRGLRAEFRDIQSDLDFFRVGEQYGIRKKSKFSLIEDVRAHEVLDWLGSQGIVGQLMPENKHYQGEIIITEEEICRN